jgi:pimeloyl-ACP methyl ester carboxylesterase
MVKLRKLLRRLAIIIAIPAVVFTAASAYYAWHQTNPPRRAVGPVPKDFPFAVEEVRFQAQDGMPLAGWFLPCPGATRVAVLLHGGRRNRLAMVPHARLLREHGYAVLLYDARGHGESGDAPDSFGWHETRDLLGAMDYLRGRGFHEFGLLGLSQGGITIALAADRLRDLRWVVLECTPADVRDIFDHDSRSTVGLPGWLAGALVVPMLEWRLGVTFKDYVPRDTVAKLHCPMFIIAGDADVRVLPAEAREVFDHANKPKYFWLISGVGHTNFYATIGKAYEGPLLRFIDLAMK